MTKHAVSVKNYEHVPEVSKAFQKKTIKGYHNLLLNVTFFSLVCVFKTFRKESINYFELDPAHYWPTPGYSFDRILKLTDVNLNLISNIKMYQFTKVWNYNKERYLFDF